MQQEARAQLAKEILEDYDNNPTLAKIVVESIAQQMVNMSEAQIQAAKQQSAKIDYLYNLQKKEIGLKVVKQVDEEQDYQNDVTNKKESKDQFKVLSKTIDKFKLLGYNSKGWPIYRSTDVYYASDPHTQKIYEDKLSNYTKNERPRKNKQYKQEIYNQILEKWRNRQNDQFNEQDKDQMDEQQLKQIVADMGEKRQNFFLYYKEFNQASKQYFQPIDIKYSPLNSCDFLQNFNKGVLRRKQQYVNIEQFQQQQNKAETFEFGQKQQEKKTTKYWGEKHKEQQNLLPIKMNVFNIQDQLLNTTSANNSNSLSLTSAIIKQHSYINSQAVKQKYKLPLEQLQRIQIDLSNPNFFLKKVSLGVSKRIEQLYSKALDMNRTKIALTNQQMKNRMDQSVISQSSRHTGGPTVSLKPVSDSVLIIQSTGLDSFDNLINEKARAQTQKKVAIKHSDVANKMMFTKFKVEPKDFINFHRYNYPWKKHNNFQLNVTLVKPKHTKIKGQFLQLNTQKQQSQVKFSQFSSLSLSSGDFIAVQNIQQSPLIMSNIGMCTKMFLQVNPRQIVDRMHTEIYKERQFEQLEEARQRVNLNKQSLGDNCASWRKIITQSLGPNGKLHICSDNSSLLIGYPQGMGVAVMESNLAAVPVVKQKTNNQDFILVREGSNWYLRKLQTTYTSGQIQPKMQVFSPDSRNITNFIVSYFKAFVKKKFQQPSNVRLQQLKDTFSIINEHNIRKYLKEMGARAKDSQHFTGSEITKDLDFQITPQQVCQYQKMQHNLYNLQSLGITHIKTPDKLKQTITTFFKKYPDSQRQFALSKFISDELQLTSWYLSESFLNAEQGQSKIQLQGLGDPTNGHGGYSFIKKPQKQRVQKQQQIQQKVDKKVSGTQYDLRKLTTKQIQKLLVQRGKKPEDFAKMSRWPKINMLKKIGGDQYQRPQRHDKKKKKQTQKRQISGIFNRLLKNISPDVQIQQVNVNQPDTVTIKYYMDRERHNWQIRRKKLFNLAGGDDKQDDDNDNDQ